jgi:hypothetical protein
VNGAETVAAAPATRVRGADPIAVRDAALSVLDVYVAVAGHRDEAPAGFEDPGPLLVAALSAGPARPDGPPPVPAAVPVWLRGCSGDTAHLGVNSRGMAGFVLGLSDAADTWPSLRPAAGRARARLVELSAAYPWRRTDLGWPDYDIISGPAGTLAALVADPGCTADECAPLVNHLAALCATDDLGTLRVGQYRDDKLRHFNFGRVNAGMGHGAPGIAAALRAAADADVLSDAGYAALSRLATWLARQSFVDARGLRTWSTVGLTPTERSAVARHAANRQAWCYGTPGIAWTLWDAARVLGDAELGALALEAARSFVDSYDDEFHLETTYPDNVAICHGAAGLLLIVDAFDRHARLPGTAALRDHLAGYLRQRLDRVVELAQDNFDLLEGACGVLAALLTYRRGDTRRWLGAFGLR